MSTDAVSTFETALSALDVRCTRTDPEGFDEALSDAVEEPAVGAPLPFEDCSLTDTPVTVDPTADELRAATTGVTAASLGIAELGSIAVRSTPGGDEPISLYADRHVAVLDRTDLVADLPAAIDRLGAAARDGGSSVLATGPSATADMGSLVKGAHGPEAVHVLVIDR